MKKLVFALAIIAGFAFAANNVQAQNNADNDQKQQTSQNVRPGFVDNDGDGVCDNYDGNRPGKGLGPGNGNGQGRINGKGLGRGNKQGIGLGRGNGRRDGSGPRAIRDGQGGGAGNYVDTNNNGTCDNLEDGTGRQRLRDGSGSGTGQNRN
jgi:hypothetical protein